MQGIQKVVYDIIRESRKQKLAYITSAGIVEEAKKTCLVINEDKHHNDDKKTKLKRQIEQAIYQLNKKGAIRQVKTSHWTICLKFEKEEREREKRCEKEKNKYHPKVCMAIQYEYELHCPKCDTYSYEKISTKRSLGGKCKNCGKASLTITLFRYHCPVRNTYIGDPVKQCELLHYSDSRLVTNEKESGKVPIPMKWCYFDENPTRTQLEYRRDVLLPQKEEQERKDLEIYLSKYHLPRPMTKEE